MNTLPRLCSLALPAAASAAHAQCPTWMSDFAPSRTPGGFAAFSHDTTGPSPSLIVASSPISVAGVPVHQVAEFNGQTWSALGEGLSYFPRAMALRHVGGTWEVFIAGPDVLECWDGASWSDIGLTDGLPSALEARTRPRADTPREDPATGGRVRDRGRDRDELEWGG